MRAGSQALAAGILALAAGCAAPPSEAPPPVPEAEAAPGRPGWSMDSANGCRVWNGNPHHGETVRWSGACPRGLAEGQGRVEWAWTETGGPRRSVAEGDFVAGRLHGRGRVVTADGSVREGSFVEGRMSGQGRAEFATVAAPVPATPSPRTSVLARGYAVSYVGDWKDGRPHGDGVMVFTNGSRYDGTWRQGLPEGIGSFWTADGRRIDGVWRRGCAIDFAAPRSLRDQGPEVCRDSLRIEFHPAAASPVSSR
ncbi:MORN repeat-containing protein [Paracraurococcus lichenis]|uniref:MORN repeat-containing protein n=1 Tax=Paracraurococcus lichenis TaxID=3064888 RepID=A0ABT9DUT5_9PROT|nr:hypothetical protein [Paracraurococcus sp. LOR1-02]MDO9707667.1 hypothetical protein [Paracraurococcus sp. LOR1-02]